MSSGLIQLRVESSVAISIADLPKSVIVFVGVRR